VLENTHNRCGGTVLGANYMREAGRLAHSLGMRFHVDGARIFNAAAALQTPAKELVSEADSVTFCLSKALCAPVGSVLCGSAEFIYQARRIRKQLGGGMRQAGVLAAAGLVALDEMIDRLKEDHRRAQMLADLLVKIPGIELSFGLPQSNMVFIHLTPDVPLTAAQAAKHLLEHQVKVGVVAERRFRLVTHYWVTDEGVEQAVNAFRAIL
jgi:threonine aldolase